MCDYSLAYFPNRLAVEGEQLVVHRFPCGTLGLASSRRTLWQRLFPSGVPAVCVPPGARLLVRDIPDKLQKGLGLGSGVQEVVFTEIGTAGFRDAIRFSNGAELILQRLTEGQRVRVLALSSEDNVRGPSWELEHLASSDMAH